jgi:NAD(P)-dependent dehydrogenase (short-subunit alcohol dehydrogenase family)
MSLPKFTKTWHSDVYDAINPTRPELSAKGSLVVITGGGSGIGPKIAEAFAQAHAANIAILGRTEKTLLSTKTFLESKYDAKVHTFVADISDAAAVNETFKSISALGHIRFFVNNAGYLPNIGTIKDSDADEWLQGHEINVKGSFLVTRGFLRGAASNAVLINVSSAIAHVPAVPGHSAYSVSKLASTKFFEYVQLEHPEIRVINFHPGVIKTNMAQKAKAQSGIEWPLDKGQSFNFVFDTVC